jgi:hypothetical protein
MADPPTLTTRTLGETENALRTLLVNSLAGSGLDYHGWVALTLVARSPSPLGEADLTTPLSDILKIDDGAARRVIDDLRALKVLAGHGDAVATMPKGASLFARLSRDIGRLTDELWAGLDEHDLAAAYRVHTTIPQRANELLARVVAGDRRSVRSGPAVRSRGRETSEQAVHDTVGVGECRCAAGHQRVGARLRRTPSSDRETNERLSGDRRPCGDRGAAGRVLRCRDDERLRPRRVAVHG